MVFDRASGNRCLLDGVGMDESDEFATEDRREVKRTLPRRVESTMTILVRQTKTGISFFQSESWGRSRERTDVPLLLLNQRYERKIRSSQTESPSIDMTIRRFEVGMSWITIFDIPSSCSLVGCSRSLSFVSTVRMHFEEGGRTDERKVGESEVDGLGDERGVLKDGMESIVAIHTAE